MRTFPVQLRRARRGLSRLFGRIAFAMMVGPPLAMAVLVLLASVVDTNTAVVAVGVAWTFAWVPGVWIMMAAAVLVGRRYDVRAEHLVVDGGGVAWLQPTAPARKEIAANAIESALFVDGTVPEAEITLRNGDVLYATCENGTAAADLVAALGFGARERRSVFHTGQGAVEIRAGCMGVILGLVVSSFGSCSLALLAEAALPSTRIGEGAWFGLFAALFFATTFGIARAFGSRRIVVGNDVVMVERFFGVKRIPMASIVETSIRAKGAGIVVRDGGGERFVLLSSARGVRCVALCDRIREALEDRDQAVVSAAHLGRGGRTLGDWREALRAVVGGGYRREALPSELLLRVVTRADAPLEQRLGAAIAIGLTDDADARAKLRVAVEGLADDGDREAMARVADGTADDAMLDALTAERGRRAS